MCSAFNSSQTILAWNQVSKDYKYNVKTVGTGTQYITRISVLNGKSTVLKKLSIVLYCLRCM